MKILHIDKFLRRKGGSPAYMIDLAEAQRDRGHETAFFSMAHPDNIASEFESLFVAHRDLNEPSGGVGERVVTAAEMVFNLRARRNVEQVIDRFRPDVVHLHNIYHQLSPSILGPMAKAKLPVVMTVHDYKLICPSYSLLAHGEICEACIGGSFSPAVRLRCKDGSLAKSSLLALESHVHRTFRSYRHVHRFIAPSRFMADLLVRGEVYPDRIVHVPHFIDPPADAPTPRDARTVLYCGRLSPEKGIDTLIQACDGLDVDLYIAGAGPIRDELEAQASNITTARVTFTGTLSKAEVLTMMRRATVGVLPARWYENQPISLLEGMACGLPMIGTNLGGTPELIEHGVTGLLVPPNSPGALRTAIAELIAAPERRSSFSEAGLSLVRQVHGRDTHLERIEAVYEQAEDMVR